MRLFGFIIFGLIYIKETMIYCNEFGNEDISLNKIIHTEIDSKFNYTNDKHEKLKLFEKLYKISHEVIKSQKENINEISQIIKELFNKDKQINEHIKNLMK